MKNNFGCTMNLKKRPVVNEHLPEMRNWITNQNKKRTCLTKRADTRQRITTRKAEGTFPLTSNLCLWAMSPLFMFYDPPQSQNSEPTSQSPLFSPPVPTFDAAQVQRSRMKISRVIDKSASLERVVDQQDTTHNEATETQTINGKMSCRMMPPWNVEIGTPHPTDGNNTESGSLLEFEYLGQGPRGIRECTNFYIRTWTQKSEAPNKGWALRTVTFTYSVFLWSLSPLFSPLLSLTAWCSWFCSLWNHSFRAQGTPRAPSTMKALQNKATNWHREET